MANNPKITNLGATTEADAICALLNTGYLKIYDGTQPATADTAITTQNLLASLRFGATAFAGSVNGLATANSITGDTDAAATGTASWFRCLKSDGTAVVFDGSVGTAGCDLNLNSVAIQQHAEVDVRAFTFIQPKG